VKDRLDYGLRHTLLNELREAEGQLNEARRTIEYMDVGVPPESVWLAWHKCHEAATNLLNVAEALK